MKYQAVLFDLDGTLLDTLRDIADSANAALVSLGLPAHELVAYRRMVGEGRDVLVRRSLPEGARDRATLEEMGRRFENEYTSRWRRHSLPYAGVPEMLDALAAGGVRLAVLSNKPHDFTEMMVRAQLPRWHFESVTGARPGVPRKPDPAVALQIARALGVEPANILFLGDSEFDMKTAVSAGMYPAGALWGFRDANELRDSGARELLASPPDLLRLL